MGLLTGSHGRVRLQVKRVGGGRLQVGNIVLKVAFTDGFLQLQTVSL